MQNSASIGQSFPHVSSPYASKACQKYRSLILHDIFTEIKLEIKIVYKNVYLETRDCQKLLKLEQLRVAFIL